MAEYKPKESKKNVVGRELLPYEYGPLTVLDADQSSGVITKKGIRTIGLNVPALTNIKKIYLCL